MIFNSNIGLSRVGSKRAYQVSPPPEPPASEFVDTINTWQGAVTTDGFTVAAKMEKFNRPVKLAVYSDEARTQLVTESATKNTGLLKEVKLDVAGLQDNTQYYWAVISNNQQCSVKGQIRTLPIGAVSFKIVVGACAHGLDGANGTSNHEVFEFIKDNHADAALLIHTGDLHYMDRNSTDPSVYDFCYNSVLENPRQQELYNTLSIWHMWDDHDFCGNNSGGGSVGKRAAIEAYKKREPHYPLIFDGETLPVGQKQVIGRVLFINPDTRSQRILGETFFGEAQKQWIKDTLLTATEPVIVINTGVPWISFNAADSWAFAADERLEMMDFFEANNLNDRIVMIAGDAHMVAIDDGTNNEGIPMFQFASFDSPPSIKGGPYSMGEFPGRGQFGTLEFTDNGTSITVKGQGHKYIDGVYTPLISYTKTFQG